jgi:Ca2+-binding EF-hand superfamily protein
MNAKHTLATLTILLATVAVAVAAESKPTGPASPKPAVKPLPKPPEVMKDAVEPFHPPKERGRFFTATGPDSEMSADEFAATRGKKDSFVRVFDSFKAMSRFDRNSNKTIDWFEAKAYREDIRKRVLLAFDADKDGKLKGPERDKANRLLATGKVPAAKTDAGATARSERAEEWKKRRDEMIAKHDADKDGKLSGAERRAAWDDVRKQWATKAFDADKNGTLDEKETAAMKKAQAEGKATYDRWRSDWVKKYDSDGDGELSEEESKVAREKVTAEFKKLRDSFTSKWDADNDGKLSEEERKAMRESLRSRAEELRKEIDADGDGEVTREERRAFFDKLKKTYDVDGDGVLSSDETKAMIQDQMRRFTSGKSTKP